MLRRHPLAAVASSQLYFSKIGLAATSAGLSSAVRVIPGLILVAFAAWAGALYGLITGWGLLWCGMLDPALSSDAEPLVSVGAVGIYSLR